MARRSALAAAAVVASALLLALLALAMAPQHAQAAVMGIDFGSEFIKVASVKPGTPFHIVIDEQAKRKIPAVVAFDHGERHFGNGALQLAIRKPKDTYLWAHRLLGKDMQSPQVAELRRQGFPWELVEMPGRRSLGFRHAKGATEAEDVIFSVEEIVAMSLQHVMKIAEVDADGVPVKDCVITVPPQWSHRERRALLDAAEIAGLNVLSLIDENTAAGVQYGIDRKYNSSDPAHTIMLYNMGSTATQVSVLRYTSYVKKEARGKSGNRTVGQMDVLGMGYDESLGGAAWEARIVDWIAKEVNVQLAAKAAKSGKTAFDIRTNPKALAKMRAAAEKAKIVLSANQESQVFLSSLHDDMDFKMMLTRAEFLEFSADLVDRAMGPCERALAEAGLDVSEVDAVVIIGGGVRIPVIQQKLLAFSGKPALTQSLDGDEAAVMGAVFRAANLSTAFKVRPFGLNDVTPYAVGVRLTTEPTEAAAAPTTAAAAAAATEEGTEDVSSEDSAVPAATGTDASAPAPTFSKRASLFKRHNKLGKKKTVQFSHNGDFVAQLSYEPSAASGSPTTLPEGIPLPLDLYNVTGVSRLVNSTRYQDLLKEQKPKLALSFLLDESGIVTLTRAEATLEEMVKVPKLKPKKNNTAKADATVNATATPAAEETAEAAEKKEGEADAPPADSPDAAAADAAAPATEGADASATPDAATDAAAAEEEPEFTLKKKTHTIPLSVIRLGSPGSIESMNATHKLLAKASLEKLRRADDLRKAIAAAKNTLEAYIYTTRTSMHEGEGVEEVSTPAQREEVLSELAAAEDWLYEQADDSVSIFTDKLATLRKLSDPIHFRVAEASALPTALNTTRALLTFVGKQLADYPTGRPWVPEADLKRLADLHEDVSDWLADSVAAQEKLSKFEAPSLDSEALYERIRPLHRLSNDLSKIKKPAEKPKKKSKKNNKNKTEDAETTNANRTAEEEEAEAAAAAKEEAEENTSSKASTEENTQQQQVPKTEGEETEATSTQGDASSATEAESKDEL